MPIIVTKNSSTATDIPTSSQLVQGELAVNVTDRRLFTENASAAVVEIGTNPTSLTTGVVNATSLTSTGAIQGTVVTATTNFTGNITGNLTGNSAGTHTGAVTGNVAGNIIGSGNSILTTLATTNFTAGGLAYPSADGAASTVLATNGSGTLSFISVSGAYALATQSEAQAGTETTGKIFSPLRVKQAIDALALPSQTGETGKFLSTNGLISSWATITIDPTLGTLTKTFTKGEAATITLSSSVLAPVVSVTKEVPQTGATNNNWDAAAGSYTLEDTAPATSLSWVADLASSSFVDSFSVGAQESAVQGVKFNTDGTKMFVIGTSGDDINEYTLSTEFDVSTSSFVDSFSVTAQGSEPVGVAFNDTGSKMYWLDQNFRKVYFYTLTANFDVSTASYGFASFSVASQDSTPTDMDFNADGTKMFIIGQSGSVYEYALSTGFDISTSSFVDSFSVSSETADPQSVAFTNNGLSMFVVGITDTVYLYNLTVGYDVSTASYSSVSVDISANDANPKGLTFNADGSKMFVADQTGTDSISEYAIPEVLALGTGSFASTDVGKTIEVNSGVLVLTATTGTYSETTTLSSTDTAASGEWSMNAVVYNSVADVLETSSVVNGFDISVGSYSSVSLNVYSQDTAPQSLAFNADGSKMFVVGGAGDDINEYALSTGFDLSTASYTQNFSVATQANTPRSIAFNTDGTKMFVVGLISKAVNEYALSTGFNVGTASYTQNFSISAQEPNPTGLAFNNDGTKMYVCGTGYAAIQEYALSTGFNVSTAVFTVSFSVNLTAGAPQSVKFNHDGTKMFVLDSGEDDVNEYTLTTAFDVSTASFTSIQLSITSQEANPTGLAFSADGTQMYIVGTSAAIYQYTTGISKVATGYQPCISSNIDTTYWTDINSLTATNAVGDGNLFYAISNDNRTSWSVIANAGVGATFAVTVANAGSGNKFYIDGVSQNSLTLTEGQTYKFDQSSATNATHPLRLSITSDGTHGGGSEYTTGVTIVGTAGSSGAYTQIVVAAGAPTIYYYCTNHSGMGGAISTVTNAPRKIARVNAGTYQYNSNSSYGSETWVAASTNTEVQALRDSMAQEVGFQLASAAYVQNFSVASQDNSPSALAFNTDGTKMFVVGYQNDSVNEYALSTGFDVSTATFTDAFSVAAQENTPFGLAFSADGTKMFVCGLTGQDVNEYTLTTGFDVSTASYTRVFSVASQETQPTGIIFNTDGSKMFVVGYTSDNVNEYALTTGFNVSTASFTDAFSVSSQDSIPSGIAFNTDGTKMYVCGQTGKNVNEYTLTTGFDVSTASYTQVFNPTATYANPPVDIAFSADGKKMFILSQGDGTQIVSQWSTAAMVAIASNQMNSTTLNAITDANQITLGTDLDFAAILYMGAGSTVPTYSGTAINYDAAIINRGAILGTDYNYDFPTSTSVVFTSVNANNLKVRVL